VTSNEPGAYVIEVTAEKCHHLAVDIALDLVVVDLEAVREVVDAVDVTAVAVVVVMMVDVLFMTNRPIKSMVPRRKLNGVSRWIISLLDAGNAKQEHIGQPRGTKIRQSNTP